ncbi:MAG TPA: YihY/virulence factor BrkB family protein [Solirubrobacteraceae bacterium]|nr:YihY/virulence factor BrkB family protein [Solirubrobacteraceae bacterium]
MGLLEPAHRFDRFQQRTKWLAIPLAVVKKAGDDQGGNLAALVAYFGFFSLFPLLLVFTTILGYVLAGDPSTQHKVEQSITHQFPSLSSSLPLHSISGSAVALILGLLTSLWAGLGVTNAAQNLMDTVWAVPRKDRPNFIKSRLRGLGLLAFLGALFVLSTIVTGAVSSSFGGVGAKIGGYVISLLVNGLLFFASFRLMTNDVSARDLLPGSAVGALLWTILQSIGSLYLHHIKTTNYGVFAVVIPLIIWLQLGGQVFMYSAEVNVVVSRGLWPRSFFGPPAAPADQETLTALAKAEERSDEQRVDVEFSEPAEPGGDGGGGAPGVARPGKTSPPPR